MTTAKKTTSSPKFGLQGSVIAWQDPWAREISDQFMRTGTGQIYPSQDATPTVDEFLSLLKKMKTDFYVHHLFPNLQGQDQLLHDMKEYDIELCLGNEYGNINGPWVEGTNRYDVPDGPLIVAAHTGQLIGLLYDEPEHLQINAGQYRKDQWSPHWGSCEADDLQQSRQKFTQAVSERVNHVQHVLANAGLPKLSIPLISEQVFPVLFHAQARGGMALCPKIMKEEFQSLQLATALGAAKQYGRPMWICADLWGPDVGAWPIRTPGFPGHSPEEFESALRMGYYMGPSHLFTENIDVLFSYDVKNGFKSNVFGDIWQSFVHEFVPAHPLPWSHTDAEPDIVLIHSDDSNYGQNERPFGNLGLSMPDTTQSVFHIWHLISHGTIPTHGNNMHISGYPFPRHELKRLVPSELFPLAHGKKLGVSANLHPLFYPTNNVLVYDEFVTEDQIGNPQLIFVAGSSVSKETLRAVRKKAEIGATVIIAEWLLLSGGEVLDEWHHPQRFDSGGAWLPTTNFLDEQVIELSAPMLGQPDCWIQRFGNHEVRMYKKDAAGFTLNFEIVG